MRVSKTKDGHIEIDVENGHGKLTVTQVDAVSLHSELGKALGRSTYVIGADTVKPCVSPPGEIITGSVTQVYDTKTGFVVPEKKKRKNAES